jgi:fatty-acyl-CoA synthase
MLAGGILAPINPRCTVSEVSDLLIDRYQSKFAFYDDARATVVREVGTKMPGLGLRTIAEVAALRHRSAPSASRREEIGENTPVAIIPTSGSTARPKGVVFSHRTLVNYVSQFALAEPNAADRARIIVFAPLSTSAGYVVMTQYLSYGGTVFIDDAFDAERALSRIVKDKITVIMGVPIFFERMAACADFAGADLSSVRLATVGGSRVSKSLLETLMGKGILPRQLYGQTEAGGQVTINTLEASQTAPEKCGRGNLFTRIAIMDVDGAFCPPGKPGEIVVKGSGTMVGYWNDPEATAKTVVDGWLHTGDLGTIDEEGLLTMVDRIKDIVISGGQNISAAELERVISEIPGIEEVSVISAKDEKFGETPLAIIYGSREIEAAEIIAHCNKHLSDYKVPRYVAIEREPLPRLATNKISKPALRVKYSDAHLWLRRVR